MNSSGNLTGIGFVASTEERIPANCADGETFCLPASYTKCIRCAVMKLSDTPAQPTRPIPVRLSGPTTRRLDGVARRLACPRAVVIRLAIHQILPEIEAGHLILRDGKEVAA